MTHTQHLVSADLEPLEPSWTGRVIGGRFRIGEPLGNGGVAVVYRAEHLQLGRPVAVKALHACLETHEEARGRFAREAKALAALGHPHVVSLIDYGVEEQIPYLVMELLEGESLDQTLAREGALDVDRALSIARQTLRALAFAHQRGLLHRDIKPGNVFLQTVGDDIHVKVLDFGLAKFVERESRSGQVLTRVGTVSGTPEYMAPEQAGGQEADARADVYATGVLLFEMLAGRCPFEGSGSEIMRAKLTGEAPSVSSVRTRKDIAPELDALVARALAREPRGRFATAGKMLEALEAVPAFVPPAPPKKSSAFPAWLPLLLLAPVMLGGMVCVGAGITLFLLAGTDDEAIETTEVSSESASPFFDLLDEGPPDPWAEDLPSPLAEVRDRVEAGEDIDASLHTELVQYADRERSDARAQLLLGHVYSGRHWRSDALSRYEAAARIDSAVRHDPRMLDNLIELAAMRGRLGTRAADAVARIYGAEAVEALDRRLESDETRRDQAERLRDLRRRVAPRNEQAAE